MNFDAIAAEVLVTLRGHEMNPVGLGIGFTYSTSEFNELAAMKTEEVVSDNILLFDGQTRDVQ